MEIKRGERRRGVIREAMKIVSNVRLKTEKKRREREIERERVAICIPDAHLEAGKRRGRGRAVLSRRLFMANFKPPKCGRCNN